MTTISTLNLTLSSHPWEFFEGSGKASTTLQWGRTKMSAILEEGRAKVSAILEEERGKESAIFQQGSLRSSTS